MVPEQLDLVGSCVIELPGECGICYLGGSIDYLAVSQNVRHRVRNVWADKTWSAHVAIAFDVMRKPSKIRTLQLVSFFLLISQAPTQCRDEWLPRCRLAESVGSLTFASASARGLCETGQFP